MKKALAKKPFAAKWILANKKDPNSPIAFVEDRDRLAGSPLLLEVAPGNCVVHDKPLHTLTQTVNKVDKALRPAFKSSLERRIADNDLPPTAGAIILRGKPQLYLKRFPPPPPKKKPAEELSEKLVRVLMEERQRGPDSYPAELNHLVEQAGLAVTPALLKQAWPRAVPQPNRPRSTASAQ